METRRAQIASLEATAKAIGDENLLTYAKIEAKNLETGNKLNERFRSEDKVERVTLEQKDFSFLYAQDDALVFMDDATYEQIELQKPADIQGGSGPQARRVEVTLQ